MIKYSDGVDHMSYIALYRQYRPKTFSEVAGQKAITQTLSNAVKKNKIGHAYLFSGPRGTGKTSIARIFAKAVNCLNPKDGDACGICRHCVGLDNNTIPDVIEIDAASNNGVDDIRELREKSRYAPSLCPYKIYIIDEVHMLTQNAFNALLKTLEEPPGHVIFILATTELHKIPATILSRCQSYEFRNIELNDMIIKLEEIILKEKIMIDDESIRVIAENAEGSLRDAIGLLDQVLAFSENEIKLDDVHQVAGSVSSQILEKMIEGILAKDTNLVLTTLDSLLESGKEISKVVNDLILAFRDILLLKNTDFKLDRYQNVLNKLPTNKIYFYLKILNELQQNIKWTNQKRVYVELALIQMMNHEILTSLDLESDLKALKLEITNLKEELSNRPIVQVQAERIDHNGDKPLITSKDVETVLNTGNPRKRKLIETKWLEMLNEIEGRLEITAHLLLKTTIEAISTSEILLVAEDLSTAQRLYNHDVYAEALKLIQNLDKGIKTIHIIRNSEWEVLKQSFLDQYQAGRKKPELPEIDLKLYKVEVTTEKEESKIAQMAKEYFGDKAIIKE